MEPAIRVLVVEDSVVVRDLLVRILESDSAVRVVGTAHDGLEALSLAESERPDVITMDIHMPRMGGLEATRRIMERRPTPIVIVSGSLDPREPATAFEAMEAGALAVVPRPVSLVSPGHAEMARDLVETVKLMSEVRVVRRWVRAEKCQPATRTLEPRVAVKPSRKVIALGASTGGPPVLQKILADLPADLPVPVLVVQHMTAGFVEGFVHWLNQTSRIPIVVAGRGQLIQPGTAYVAPDGVQMMVDRSGRIAITDDPSDQPHRPSVSALFRSVADVYGPEAVAGLLSGMGRDGVDELKALRDCGAVTFAQSRASCVVFGMPGEAVRLDAVSLVLEPDAMAPTLVKILSEGKGE